MIKTTNMILAELSSYTNPKAKLSRLVKEGTYIQIVRGLYETDRGVPRHLLAGSIYGPSYISFAYALGFYGMIPEAAMRLQVLRLKRERIRNITRLLVCSFIEMFHPPYSLWASDSCRRGTIFIASQNPRRHFAISFIPCRRPQTQGSCLHSCLTISAWKRRRFSI